MHAGLLLSRKCGKDDRQSIKESKTLRLWQTTRPVYLNGTQQRRFPFCGRKTMSRPAYGFMQRMTDINKSSGTCACVICACLRLGNANCTVGSIAPELNSAPRHKGTRRGYIRVPFRSRPSNYTVHNRNWLQLLDARASNMHHYCTSLQAAPHLHLYQSNVSPTTSIQPYLQRRSAIC